VIVKLKRHHWLGNVRELEHTIEYAMNMIDGDTMTMDHLPAFFEKQDTEDKSMIKPLRVVVEETERNLIQQALTETNGNILKASTILKLPRQTLQYKMKKYNIQVIENELS
jgi:arginine utilization regulatory protein